MTAHFDLFHFALLWYDTFTFSISGLGMALSWDPSQTFSMFWDASQNNWCSSQTYPKRRCSTILPLCLCHNWLHGRSLQVLQHNTATLATKGNKETSIVIRRRMYSANALSKIADKLEEGLHEVSNSSARIKVTQCKIKFSLQSPLSPKLGLNLTVVGWWFGPWAN